MPVLQLLLVRHAEAEMPGLHTPDFERELTTAGMQAAANLGKRLADAGCRPDLITASAAQRTMMTATLLAEQLGYDPDAIIGSRDIYEASLRTLLAAVQALPDTASTIILVNHNPSISFLAEHLTHTSVMFPPCGAMLLHIDLPRWSEVGMNTAQIAWQHFD